MVDHPSAQPASEVLVIEPRAFEESLEIVEHLRGRKSVLLNLHMLDKEGLTTHCRFPFWRLSRH